MCRIIPAIAVVFCAFSQLVSAQTPELVAHGKRATALVEIQEGAARKGFGSAFCVDESGLFVTNFHVAQAVASAKLKLVLNPGEADQKAFPAHVVRSDKGMDLALLQVEGGEKFTPLPLGKTENLFETEEVTAYGYPFGIGLALDPKEYPAVSVNSGRITSLRKKVGELDLIQLDAVLNPGNSGGPVVDGAGNVIGIVQMGVPGAGINFAIPVSHLHTLLEKPLVTMDPASIAYADRGKPRTFTVHVTSFGKETAGDSVELSINGVGHAPRIFIAPLKNGISEFKDVTPVPDDGGRKWLRLSANFEHGSVVGYVTDQDIQIGGKPAHLSGIKDLKDGVASGELAGIATGIDAIKIDLGNATTTIDLTKAHTATIGPVDANAITSIACMVVVKAGEKSLSQDREVVALSGAPSAAPAAGNAGNTGIASTGTTSAVGPDDIKQEFALLNKEPNITVTKMCGGGRNNFYASVYSKSLRPVLGIRLQMAERGNEPVQNIVPLWEKPDVVGKTQFFGKDGYVVGGLICAGEEHVDAVKIIWIRIEDNVLKPDDTYESDWYGNPGDSSIVKIAGNGECVVGIYGSKFGTSWDGIGLLLKK